jgi:hypothetical protein
MFSRDHLKRAASLTEEDFVQLGRCVLQAARPDQRLRAAGTDEHLFCLNLILACISCWQARPVCSLSFVRSIY